MPDTASASSDTPTQLPELDLTTCDREPIHIPGSIQPQGVLLALREPDLSVLQVSANAGALVGAEPEAILGRSVFEVLAPQDEAVLRVGLANPSLERSPLHLGVVSARTGGHFFHALAHRMDGVLILELESTATAAAVSFHGLYPLVRTFLSRLEKMGSTEELNQLAAAEVRRVTGFDRVLIYQFDSEWNGKVVAEDRNDRLPSYLGLHFPASDIPRQARELYRLNRIRLIRDANYRPMPLVPVLNPTTGKPLDLSYGTFRSVSPVHLEYMRNMGTLASMSISIIREGQLWGLISCHHQDAREIPFDVRTACDLLGQVLSLQLEAKEHAADFDHRLQLRVSQEKLIAAMAEAEFYLNGLLKVPAELLRFLDAGGAALIDGKECRLIGETPAREWVLRLADWLGERGEDTFVTNSLSQLWPEGEQEIARASGVAAISLSRLHRRWLIWFRPEVLQTVTWGGDPRKPVEPPSGAATGTNAAPSETAPQRLHPRKSFEAWQEIVQRKSLPWALGEADAIRELRAAIVNIVLRRAEELAQLSDELERSNKELEAFSYSISHDLRAPFRHIAGFSQLLQSSEGDRLSATGSRYLQTIADSAKRAGLLVDSLLTFSRMGRSALHPTDVDPNLLVRDALREQAMELRDREVEWELGQLPRVWADVMTLGQVWRNLISNAVKYTVSRRPARIQIFHREEETEWVFVVQDNGIGFDPQYTHKLFGVFQRLHSVEEFEGIGIGLANVRRIIERHGGRVWAEGRPGEGATFFFTLPKRELGSVVS